MSRSELLDALLLLLPAQFEVLIAKSGILKALLAKGTQAEQAVALLQIFEQQKNGLHELEIILKDVQQRHSTVQSPTHQTPTGFPGAFQIGQSGETTPTNEHREGPGSNVRRTRAQRPRYDDSMLIVLGTLLIAILIIVALAFIAYVHN